MIGQGEHIPAVVTCATDMIEAQLFFLLGYSESSKMLRVEDGESDWTESFLYQNRCIDHGLLTKQGEEASGGLNGQSESGSRRLTGINFHACSICLIRVCIDRVNSRQEE